MTEETMTPQELVSTQEKIATILGNIKLPYMMSDNEKKLYRLRIESYGRRKLKDTLIREGELRYNAEQTLLAEGYCMDHHGRWAKPAPVEEVKNDNG